jgi:hypothetical protein
MRFLTSLRVGFLPDRRLILTFRICRFTKAFCTAGNWLLLCTQSVLQSRECFKVVHMYLFPKRKIFFSPYLQSKECFKVVFICPQKQNISLVYIYGAKNVLKLYLHIPQKKNMSLVRIYRAKNVYKLHLSIPKSKIFL